MDSQPPYFIFRRPISSWRELEEIPVFNELKDLRQHLIRSGRTTPFKDRSVLSLGQVAEKDSFTSEEEVLVRNFSPTGAEVSKWNRERPSPRFHLNPTFTKTGNIVSYIGFKFGQVVDGKRTTMELSPDLIKLLQQTKTPLKREKLDLLLQTPLKDPQQRLALINFLISKEILVPENVSGIHHQDEISDGNFQLIDSDFRPQLSKERYQEMLKHIQLIEESFSRKTTAHSPIAHALSSFAEVFLRKLGQKTVPLKDVIGSPNGIPLNIDPDFGMQAFSKLEHFLSQKLINHPPEKGKRWQISLSPGDWDELTLIDRTFRSMSVAPGTGQNHPDLLLFCSLEKEKTYIKYLHRAPSSSFFTRFAVNWKSLRERLQDSVKLDEALANERILADINYLGTDLQTTLTIRPRLHKYSINLQIPQNTEFDLCLDDLYVTVKNGRVVLLSESLRKEILPLQNSPHQFLNSHNPYYRFLCCLFYQNSHRSISFSFGSHTTLPRLPRVSSGNIVLNLETWNIRGADVLKNLHRLREVYDLPLWVQYARLDQTVPLRLDHPECLALLKKIAKKNYWVKLQEVFPAPDKTVCWIKGKPYLNEILLPIPRPARKEDSAQGIAWVSPEWEKKSKYFAVHLSISKNSVDHFLIRFSVLEKTLLQKTKFFYIRHVDEKLSVLRIRFKLPSGVSKDEITRIFDEEKNLTPFFDHFSVRPYLPEWQTYGGVKGIDLFQKISHLDSLLAMRILAFIRSNQQLEASEPFYKKISLSLLVLIGHQNFIHLDSPAIISELCRPRQMPHDDAAEIVQVNKEHDDYLMNQLFGDHRELDVVAQFVKENRQLLRKRSKELKQLSALVKAKEIQSTCPVFFERLTHLMINRTISTDNSLEDYFVYYGLNKFEHKLGIKREYISGILKNILSVLS